MVVSVDEPWQHDVTAGIKGIVYGFVWRFPGREYRFDFCAAYDQPAAGIQVVRGKYRQRVFDPGAWLIGHCLPPARVSCEG